MTPDATPVEVSEEHNLHARHLLACLPDVRVATIRELIDRIALFLATRDAERDRAVREEENEACMRVAWDVGMTNDFATACRIVDGILVRRARGGK